MALDFFTFTRNSEAEAILEDGSTTNVAIDTPVINFRSGAFAGYYSQVAATNLLLHSQAFDNAAWSLIVGTIVSTTEIAPDGTATATKLRMSTGDAVVLRQAVGGLTGGANYNASLFIKQVTGVSAFIDIGDSKGTPDIFPTTKWVRYDNTAAWNTGAAYVDLEFRGTDGVAEVLIWGAQLETGSVATSYIKTEATTATRDEDVATITNVADKLGLTAGSCQITALFPTDYPLIINGLQATVTGIKTIRFEYTTTTIELYVDNVLADSASGSYDWSDMDKIELGHSGGFNQPNFELRDLIIRKA